jgi:hypothetical protein
MATQEVITLQIGSNANYMGSHFWNLEEEYARCFGAAIASSAHAAAADASETALEAEMHSPNLFRHGLTSGRATITPRLVAWDLTGALGSMPDLETLYGGPTSVQDARDSLTQTWRGKVSISTCMSSQSYASSSDAAAAADDGDDVDGAFDDEMHDALADVAFDSFSGAKPVQLYRDASRAADPYLTAAAAAGSSFGSAGVDPTSGAVAPHVRCDHVVQSDQCGVLIICDIVHAFYIFV